MARKILSFLLCLMLAAPANAGIAGWMALSMTDTQMQAQDHDSMELQKHPGHGKRVGQEHGATPDSHSTSLSFVSHTDHLHSQSDAHESHDEADCNEHCVSCANHCLNLGILSASVVSSGLHSPLQGMESGNLCNYPDLLYRPPICS